MITFSKQSTSKYMVYEQVIMTDGTAKLFKMFCDNADDMHKALNNMWLIWSKDSSQHPSINNRNVHLTINNGYKPYNLPVIAIKVQCARHGRYTVAVCNFKTGKAELAVIKL